MKGAKNIIMAVILTFTAVGQIVLSIVLYNKNGSVHIRNIGWIVLWISAIFGWLPIFTLKRRGGVPKGKSYIQTTLLVNRGIYAVVRHPQYLAGMILGAALPLIAQHWLVGILGVITIVLLYRDTFEEEKSVTEKFGADYRQYKMRFLE